MKAKIFDTGEVVEVHFERNPQVGDKGEIRYSDGRSVKCEVCMAPVNRNPDPDEAPIGVYVQKID